MNGFERETIHRLCTETARFWLISHFLENKNLPDEPKVWFAYPNGSVSFDWGNRPGEFDGTQVLRGKRVRITLEIEDG